MNISIPGAKSTLSRAYIVSAIWFAILLAGSYALRSNYFERDIWNLDEGATFTMAEQILHGDVLYKDAVDHRSPLVPYLKAAVFAVAGDWNVRAQHLFFAFALGCCAFGLLCVCARLGRPVAGRWAAIMFTLLVFLLPGPTESLAIHTESFVILFSTLGFWLFARALPAGRMLSGVPIGLAFAAGTLCKQPGLLDFGVTWVILALLIWREPADRGRLARLFAGALLGFSALFALVCLYFWGHGVWHDFVYYVWTYNTRFYVPEVPTAQRLSMIHMTPDLVLANAPIALATSIAGVLLALFEVLPRLFRSKQSLPILPLLALGWLGTGLISTMLSGRPFAHYVIQVTPGLSLVSGLVLARVGSWFVATNNRRLISGWIGCALAMWVGHDVLRFRKEVLPRDEPSKIPLRTLVQRYTSPRERIFIWGYYPDGYVICQRLPATRFLYTNFLTGLIPWTNAAADVDTRYAIVPGAWDAFWRDYESARPKLIINAPIRGYLKYPMMSQARLRDEIIDHFAELQPSDFEMNDGRVFYRLAEPDTALASATSPIDESIGLHVSRDSNQIDIVVATVSAPAGTTGLTLRLGGRPYRHLEPKSDAPVEARFFLRIGDLATRGAANIDVIAARNGSTVASKSLDVIKQLVLNVRPVEPTPVLAHGTHQLPPVEAIDAARWKPAIEGNRTGWLHSGPFELTFKRPVGMTTIVFAWKISDATGTGGRSKPEILSSAKGHSPQPIESSVTTDEHGVSILSGRLPAEASMITLRWDGAETAWLGQISGRADGPLLQFGQETIAPSLSEEDEHHPFVFNPNGDVPVPFRILYPREPGVEGVVVTFGLREDAYAPGPAGGPGHVMILVSFVHDDGRVETVFTRKLDPANQPEDRGTKVARINLPMQGPGQIEISYIRQNKTTANNHAFLLAPRAMGPGPDLLISPDRVILPQESQAFGGARVNLHDPDGWLAHAPSRVVYDCPEDLRAVTIGFHLPKRAYDDGKGNRRSDGIGALVEYVDSAGVTTTLYRRIIDPFSNPADRGVIHARIELPSRAGKLVIRLTPGPYTDNAFDWSYLTEIVGEVAPPAGSK